MVSLYNLRQKSTEYNYRQECELQVNGYSKPEFKKFFTAAEAEAYMRRDQTNIPVNPPVPPPGTSSAGQKRNFSSVLDAPDERQWQVVYSDGACKGNGKIGSAAGVGVFWRPDDPRSVRYTTFNYVFT